MPDHNPLVDPAPEYGPELFMLEDFNTGKLPPPTPEGWWADALVALVRAVPHDPDAPRGARRAAVQAILRGVASDLYQGADPAILALRLYQAVEAADVP